MAKRVVARPNWIQAPAVEDIYSLSNCVSKEFADYINYWKHNGYWLFDSIGVIKQLAGEHGISLEGCTFLYYEVFDQEYNDQTNNWQSFAPESSFGLSVDPPQSKRLEGYDIVTFSVHTSPECSPLSCNNLAATIPTNSHCLLNTFDQAKQLIEGGAFDNSEPGPFRIYSVYSIEA
jgi:hypothetical protein